MSLSKFIKRSRSSTKKLLGNVYKAEVDSDVTVPEPPESTSAYTEARLKQGLYFVDQSLRNKKRQISPRAQHCFTWYKATLKAALANEYADEEEKEELLSTIQHYENSIYTNAFLRRPEPKDDRFNLITRLAELRRFEFASRYGDHLARVCKKLKIGAEQHQTEHFRQLVGWDRYWTKIAGEIEQQEDAWRKFKAHDPEIEPDQVKTVLAVLNASKSINIDFEHALEIISMYSDRNSIVHSPVDELVKNGRWDELKHCLARDLVDLPMVIPSDLQRNIPVIQTTINAVIDTYFTRHKKHPDNPHFWVAKDHVFDTVEEAKKLEKEKREKKLAELAKQQANVDKLAIKKYKKLVNDCAMVHLARASASIDLQAEESPARDSRKRPPPNATKEDLKSSCKRQKKAWDKLVRQQQSVHKSLQQYQDEWGHTQPPIDPEVWWSTDDPPEDQTEQEANAEEEETGEGDGAEVGDDHEPKSQPRTPSPESVATSHHSD